MTLTNASSERVLVPDDHTYYPVISFKVSDPSSLSFGWGGIFEGSVRWVPLAPGETKTYFPNFRPRVCKAGVYTITAEYDNSRWISAGRPPLHAVSEPAELTYDAPSGVDEEVSRTVLDYIAKHAKTSEPCAASYISTFVQQHQEFIRDFPSSAYAAYAFAGEFGYPVTVSTLDKERMCRYLDKLQKDGRAELQDTTRHVATGPDGKELRDVRGKPVPLTQGEWLKQTIDLADRISSARPELPVSEWIRSQVIASYYIQLLEFEKAASVLAVLKKNAKDSMIRQNSEQLLDLLADRGLIAK